MPTKVNLVLSVKKSDGTRIENALELIKLSSWKNPGTELRLNDILRPFHISHGKNGPCIHFLLNNTSVKGAARINSSSINNNDVLTIDAIELPPA